MSNGRRQPSRGGTSRMTRECQVRFCEGLGVKFPGPTRQKRKWRRFQVMSALPHKADINARDCDVRFVPKTDIQGSNHAGEIRAVTRPEIVVVDKAAGLARNRILRIHPPLSAHLVSSIYYSAPDAIAEF